MKIHHTENTTERQILTAMIVDPIVCGRIASKWNNNLFRSKWANLVGSWCVQYHNKYGKAPSKHIESQFRTWSGKTKDKDTISLVEKFLAGLSDEYVNLKRESNSQYILDRSGEYFSQVRIERLKDDLENDLTTNDVERALERINTFDQVKVGAGEAIDVFHDKEWWKKVFAEKEKSIIRFPGHMGDFFGDQFARGHFIAFMAPEGRGKCIPANSEVLLYDGRIKTIEEIVQTKEKTPVMALNEKTQRFEPVAISQYWDNGIKECWEVKTRTGRKVRSTSNHKYLTPTGWKTLDKLKIGDYIAVPKKLDVFGNKSLPIEEIEFLAFLLADGCCGYEGLKFTKTDPTLVAAFESCCDRLGLAHRRFQDDVIIYKSHNLRLKYPTALWKVGSKTKKIPEEIFQCPKEQIALFIRTFFSCDGSVNKNGSIIELTLANKKMCQQFSHLLIRFGIVHSFNFVKKSNQSGKRFKAWRILIRSQEYVNLFLKEINFLSYKYREPRIGIANKSTLDKFPVPIARKFYDEACTEVKKRKYGSSYFKASKAISDQLYKNKPIMRQSFAGIRKTDTYDKYINSHILWDQITGIRNIGKKRTYDIAIPKHHNFVANDCIVHNSFVLMDIAFRAIMQRRKVAYFEAGDMTEEQWGARLATRITGLPLHPCILKYPLAVRKLKSGKYVVDSKEKKFKNALDWRDVLRGCRKINKKRVRSKETYFRFSSHYANTLHVKTIESQLREWEKEGWVADIVLIDYADLLDMTYPKLEKRDQIDKTWMNLRKISQMYHCLLVTATQGNRMSYDSNIITRKHVSEDKRKLAHVTGMIGINQTEEEKKREIIRFNWIKVRDARYYESRCLAVAGCLALGNVAVRSVL